MLLQTKHSHQGVVSLLTFPNLDEVHVDQAGY